MVIDEFESMLLSPDWYNIAQRQSQKILSSRNENGGGGSSTSNSNTAIDIMSENTHQQHHQHKTTTAAAVALDVLRRQRLDKLYDASIIADQNAKLSIFATRPAIYNPFFNFLCEFMLQ